MGLMSDEILGSAPANNEKPDLRATLRTKQKKLLPVKSYLKNGKQKKAMSEHRRDFVKSSLYSALDDGSGSDNSSACESFGGDNPFVEAPKKSVMQRSLPKRSKSLSDQQKSSKKTSKLRGKKEDILAAKTQSLHAKNEPIKPIPPPPRRRQLSSPRLRRHKSHSAAAESSAAPDDKILMMSAEREKMLLKGKTEAEPGTKTKSRGKLKRHLSLGGSSKKGSSRRSDQNSVPSKPVNRSLSFIGSSRRRKDDDDSSVVTAPELDLGKRLSNLSNHESDAMSVDGMDLESGDDPNLSPGSVGSTTSWFEWATTSALKPLEKMYDELNGKPSSKKIFSDDESLSDEEEYYPNTEAEAGRMKLSTSDKIAGLRFVASKQQRKLLI